MKKELLREFDIYQGNMYQQFGKLVKLEYAKRGRVYIYNPLSPDEERREWKEDTQKNMIMTLREFNAYY